jgi:hypothetical protein
VLSGSPGLLHEVAELRMQLRRAAGDVERRDVVEKAEHRGDVLRGHHLGARGPGVHMAVHAALVAAIADIELERVELSAPDRWERDLFEPREGFAHRRQCSRIHRRRRRLRRAHNQM